MSFTDHADSLFDAGKPVLGATQLEQRDNLEAVAAGDLSGDTPPRVESAALKLGILTPGNSVSTANGVFAGMIGAVQISIDPDPTGTDGDVTLEYRTSTDGGTTTTGWTELLVVDYTAGSSPRSEMTLVNVTFPANTNFVEMREDIDGGAYGTVVSVSTCMTYGEAG